jgi:predicted RNA-binding Zn-ribbon protein involved in translation (DUF1610 family)
VERERAVAMSEQQFIFKVSDLETVSCDCPRCGTTIMVNVALMSEEHGWPAECPTCHENSGLAKVLIDYRKFYRTATALNARLRTKPVSVSDV